MDFVDEHTFAVVHHRLVRPQCAGGGPGGPNFHFRQGAPGGGPGWSALDSRPEHIRQVAEASLKRLKVERIHN